MAGSRKSCDTLFPPFDRRAFDRAHLITQAGSGSLGGKAEGLAFVQTEILPLVAGSCWEAIDLSVPRLMVIATSMFDAFMDRNELWEVAIDGRPDDRIAHAFIRAELPAELLGDLQALADMTHSPLAVRSSSLLEDALAHPFAGVYCTKMIPNHQIGSADRFTMLDEAIKFVYASTFFASAKTYRRALGIAEREEKMAIIVQEVVGERHGSRFYPDVSGVARSYSYYPFPRCRPDEGTVNLALGLGKTIVDGETSWTYTPGHPAMPPPVRSPAALLEETQSRFWAVNMAAAIYDPVRETEYLIRSTLTEAEADGTLSKVASTYDASNDSIHPGIKRSGPRVVDFAPLLRFGSIPLDACLKSLLSVCKERLGCEVELEFATCLADSERPLTRLGFLQLRPMTRPDSTIDIEDADMRGARVVVASEQCLGDGVVNDLRDVVYLKPETFDPARMPVMAEEVGAFNGALLAAGKGYVLVGFGRWGSADRWLGVPVQWAQISGAKVIVEVAFSERSPAVSQGSHFFHNLVGLHVLYLSVPLKSGFQVDWDWLSGQEAIGETAHVRHVRARSPLTARVDGWTGRGVVLQND